MREPRPIAWPRPIHGRQRRRAQKQCNRRDKELIMNQKVIQSGWSGTRFGKPQVGARAERRRITRASDVIAFSDMTGDRNPLHYDESLAGRSIFGRLIVQGGVTSGLLNAIVAENLPGPGSVFLGV